MKKDKYISVNKSMYYQNTITSFVGVIICFICVIYFMFEIKTRNETIDYLFEKYYECYNLNQTLMTDMGDTIEENIENEITIKNVYSINDNERELLAKLLYCEGGIESEECQRAIVSVIFNRLESGKWGNTLNSVIYAQGQFEPVSKGLLSKAKPKQQQYDAIDYVLQNGSTLPSWVMYFRAGHHFSWKGYTPYCQLSTTYFGGTK